MPLSEHEQRQLEEIERALYSEDPKFARAVRFKDPRVHYRRRALQGFVGFVVGVGLIMAGLASRHPWIAAAGGAVAVACGLWALAGWRRLAAITSPPTAMRPNGLRSRRRAMGGSGFMERLEERWRRRQEGGG